MWVMILTILIVGYGCCPADAMPEVRSRASYVAETNGGAGVIREIVEKILKRNRMVGNQ